MPRPNDRLGPYTLISRIGRGAFGVVWLAEKRGQIITTKVALKIPHDDDIDLGVLRNEAVVWQAACGHPNVLPIIDADLYEGQPVIVSEYAPEGSLAVWLSRHDGKAPSVDAAIRMIQGVLAGLIHLHSRNIIHRDLKPENILLQGDTPRLTDFGIARILRDTTSHSTLIAGTPKYMAPEAYRNERSQQTDIWSVGVVLYQLLTGSLPFLGDDLPSLMNSVINQPAQPLPDSVPPAIGEIVTKSLEKNPVSRYSSAEDMRNAIEQVIHSGLAVTVIDLPSAGSIQHIPEGETTRILPARGDEHGSGAEVTSEVSIKELQFEYWTELTTLLHKCHSPVRLEPPKRYFMIAGSLGRAEVKLYATASPKRREISVGVRLFNLKDLYHALEEDRHSIEAEILRSGLDAQLNWREKKNYQTVSEISSVFHSANIEWRQYWGGYLEWHQKTLEAFYNAFQSRIREFSRLPQARIRQPEKPLGSTVQTKPVVYFNNCHGRDHVRLYGKGAFYDLNTTGFQSTKARNVRQGQECIVASKGRADQIIFSRFSFLREVVMKDDTGLPCRVFFGKFLGSNEYSKTEAARKYPYANFFDVNGNFKRHSVIEG